VAVAIEGEEIAWHANHGKVLLSRHRTVPSGRSRAIALIAAGAFSVAGAAAAAAVTWPPEGARSPAALAQTQPAAPVAAPAAAAGLTITDQPTRAQASPQAVSLAVRALQIHVVQARHEAAQWKAAQRRSRRRAEAARAAAARAEAAQTAAAQAGQSPRADQSPQAPAQQTSTAASGSPEQIAKAMLRSFGWSSSQFSCLYPLWEHESGWSVTAENPGTGAYGIPQAVPGAKMASAGPDWQTSAATQIRWGLEYIKGMYGSPCGAWDHEQATGWY
jgi:hypothetical protein